MCPVSHIGSFSAVCAVKQAADFRESRAPSPGPLLSCVSWQVARLRNWQYSLTCYWSPSAITAKVGYTDLLLVQHNSFSSAGVNTKNTWLGNSVFPIALEHCRKCQYIIWDLNYILTKSVRCTHIDAYICTVRQKSI